MINVYKIMIKAGSTTKDYYSFYKTTNDVGEMVEFETENQEVLETEILKLLEKYTMDEIKVVIEVKMLLDIEFVQ